MVVPRLPPIQIHNAELRSQLRPTYTATDLHSICHWLHQRGTLQFPTYANGLFPAATVTDQTRYTGYDAVWVRDTVHIAQAHWMTGQGSIAIRAMQTLMQHFVQQLPQFDAIIHGQVDPADHYRRPAVKFVGDTLAPLPQPWPHAQNDALGYFLWLYCRLAQAKALVVDTAALEVLNRFPAYLQRIQYWQDADNGHWEEAAKVEASSLGAVVAGLQQLLALAQQQPQVADRCAPKAIAPLIAQGQAALSAILPAECVQPQHPRPTDAALLFLIYPLGVVPEAMAQQIVDNVTTHLLGDYGIKRYLGDSYWCADYPDKLAEADRTAEVSTTMAHRDRLLTPGEEAQWCVFDPIVSVIYGTWFQQRGQAEDRDRQLYYLNRSLGQITGTDHNQPPHCCPELYYLRQGRYVPNDTTPLLWTQANLMTALDSLAQTLES